MLCPKCKKEIPDIARFCSKCGSKVKSKELNVNCDTTHTYQENVVVTNSSINDLSNNLSNNSVTSSNNTQHTNNKKINFKNNLRKNPFYWLDQINLYKTLMILSFMSLVCCSFIEFLMPLYYFLFVFYIFVIAFNIFPIYKIKDLVLYGEDVLKTKESNPNIRTIFSSFKYLKKDSPFNFYAYGLAIQILWLSKSVFLMVLPYVESIFFYDEPKIILTIYKILRYSNPFVYLIVLLLTFLGYKKLSKIIEINKQKLLSIKADEETTADSRNEVLYFKLQSLCCLILGLITLVGLSFMHYFIFVTLLPGICLSIICFLKAKKIEKEHNIKLKRIKLFSMISLLCLIMVLLYYVGPFIYASYFVELCNGCGTVLAFIMVMYFIPYNGAFTSLAGMYFLKAQKEYNEQIVKVDIYKVHHDKKNVIENSKNSQTVCDRLNTLSDFAFFTPVILLLNVVPYITYVTALPSLLLSTIGIIKTSKLTKEFNINLKKVKFYFYSMITLQILQILCFLYPHYAKSQYCYSHVFTCGSYVKESTIFIFSSIIFCIAFVLCIVNELRLRRLERYFKMQ